MSTILGASASLMIRAFAYAIIAFLILLMVSIAATADTISVTPTGPLPPAEVPTITLLRDGAIMAALVILVAVVVWRASMLDLWMHSRLDLHGMAAALMHDEMVKRGIAEPVRAPVGQPAQTEPTLEDDPWVAEANKVAPPPETAPPVPRRVTPSNLSAKEMAQRLTPRTRAKGHA